VRRATRSTTNFQRIEADRTDTTQNGLVHRFVDVEVVFGSGIEKIAHLKDHFCTGYCLEIDWVFSAHVPSPFPWLSHILIRTNLKCTNGTINSECARRLMIQHLTRLTTNHFDLVMTFHGNRYLPHITFGIVENKYTIVFTVYIFFFSSNRSAFARQYQRSLPGLKIGPQTARLGTR